MINKLSYKQYKLTIEFILSHNNFAYENEVKRYLQNTFLIADTRAYAITKNMRDISLLSVAKQNNKRYLSVTKYGKEFDYTMNIAKVLYQHDNKISLDIEFENLSDDTKNEYKEFTQKFLELLEKQGLGIKRI